MTVQSYLLEGRARQEPRSLTLVKVMGDHGLIFRSQDWQKNEGSRMGQAAYSTAFILLPIARTVGRRMGTKLKGILPKVMQVFDDSQVELA